jgi:predicted aspartyl protease
MLKTPRYQMCAIGMFMLLFIESIANPLEGKIPFEIKDSHFIVIKARINQFEEYYDFVLDTGGRTFLDKGLADKLNLKQKGPMAKIGILTLDKFQIDNVFCITQFDFDIIEKSTGIRFRGMIGSDLLERFRVILDYKKKTLTLSTDNQPIVPTENGLLLPFAQHPVNNAPLVNISLNGNENIRAMIDTGQPYPLILPPIFLEKNGLFDDCSFTESKGFILKWPGTNEGKNILTRIQNFTIGRIKIENLLSFISPLPRMLSMPLLGKDFLAGFIVTLDYPRKEMLLIPQADFPFPSNEYGCGINLGMGDSENIIVRGLWIGSPADRAGLKVNAEVIALDSIPATRQNLPDIRGHLHDKKRSQIELEIRQPEGKKRIILHKEFILKKKSHPINQH